MGMILESIRQQQLKTNLPKIDPGDTVRVHVKVVEGNRERIQVFEGTVIKIARSGPDKNMTVRRISHNNIGVERTFLLHSPRVDRVEVTRKGDVRRARLYYLRNRVGKATRVREKRLAPGKLAASIEAPAPEAVNEVQPEVLDEAPAEVEAAEPQETVEEPAEVAE